MNQFATLFVASGLDRHQVARLLGLSLPTLSRYLTGRRDAPEAVVRLMWLITHADNITSVRAALEQFPRTPQWGGFW
jgi:predicted transcriptional regulator